MRAFARSSLRWLRPHWPQGVVVVLTQVPAVAFITLQPLLLKALIDDAIPHADGRLAAWLVAAIFGLLAAHAVGDLLQHYAVARLTAAVTNDLRLRICRHLLRLSSGFYARCEAGDLMARFTSDLDAIGRALADELPPSVYFVLTILVGSGVLLIIEWRLALVILALLPVMTIAARYLSARADQATDLRQQQLSRVVSAMHENLGAHLIVRAFGLDVSTLASFRSELDRFATRTTRAGLLNGLLAATMTLSGYSLLATAIGIGSFLAIRGELSVGSLVAIFELLWFMIAGVEQLAVIVPSFQQAAAGLRRIRTLLDERPEVADAAGARPLPLLSEAIRFDGVTFSHDGRAPALDGVSLTIPARRSVAIVGPSGSGKSTLLSFLMRLHDPSSGSVTFDGHDLRDITQASLRAQIGAVFQESILFNTTIRENIRVGRAEAGDEAVEAAARAAEIHEFIATLPQGYDTPVGERGGRLSAGQRQRIALARAILRQPTVLILDEATSALDAETEAAINETLERLARGRTVVSVSHRLATVARADHIIVLDRGRVVEEGTHQQLLEREGTYYRAWRRQTSFAVSADDGHITLEPTRLRTIPMFSNLAESHLAMLARSFVPEFYPEGAVISKDGAEASALRLIVRGRVEVLASEAHQESRLPAVLEDGEILGADLLEEGCWTATARTRTPCLFLTLTHGRLLDLMDAVPELRTVFEQARKVSRQTVAR